MKIISALIGALLLFQLQKYLYQRFWNKNLSVTISLSDEQAVEGEELILSETVINKKLLPLPILKVKFMTSKYLSFLDTDNSEITDKYYRNDMLSVLMYQKITRSLSFVCTHRGYFTISKIDVVFCDMFLTFEIVASYDMNINLYVYPKPVEYDKFQAPFQKMLGCVLTKRYMNEDPFEFRSIREYQSYDNLKAVNWKASAKTGSLKVTVNDYTDSQQIKILLNLESETNLKQEDVLEESIRIAATFASAFIEQGIPTSIYTNARDIITKEVLHIPAGSGSHHVKTLYETLSRIDTTQAMPGFVPTLKEELLNASNNDYMIVISSYQKNDLQLLLSSLVHSKTEFSWIIPLNKEINLTANEELMPYVVPWEL